MSERPAIVALVGLRCAGKTTLGRLVAERLGMPFVDLDQHLAQRWCVERDEPPAPAGTLLARHGLAEFRRREALSLHALLDETRPLVLATGGGCVEDQASRSRLAAETFCVWLRAAPELLARRLRADPTPRPVLGEAREDAAEELARLATRRAPWYREVARATLDAGSGTPAELAQRVVELLGGP